jgi:hypothetical protein
MNGRAVMPGDRGPGHNLEGTQLHVCGSRDRQEVIGTAVMDRSYWEQRGFDFVAIRDLQTARERQDHIQKNKGVYLVLLEVFGPAAHPCVM